MADEQTNAMWQKIDAHDEKIHQAANEQAALAARVAALETRTEKILDNLSEARAESIHQNELLNQKLDKLDEHVQQARGGLKLGAWIIGISSGAVAIAGSIWAAIEKFVK